MRAKKRSKHSLAGGRALVLGYHGNREIRAWNIPSYRQDDPSTWRPVLTVNPGSLTIRNATLRVIAAFAYDIQRPMVAGPEWLDEERYDMAAKAPGEARPAEIQAMLRRLLAERFKMECHRETRQVEALAMLLPKNGAHKLTPSKNTGGIRNRQDPERGMVIEGATLAAFATEMSREFTVPVVDLTGLEGRFDFAFNPQKYVHEFRTAMMASRERIEEAEARVILMQNILTGDLGLRLETRKAPVEMLVIDKAERSPVEN
jgi:uncharacterized protein (TIGR03435 family)